MPRDTKKDKRRADLAIPYVHTPESVQEQSASSTFSTTLPIAAIFLKSRVMSWVAFFIALQTSLNAPTEKATEDMTPAWMAASTALVGLGASYVDFITGRPGPRPKKGEAADVAETIAETVSTIVEAAKETLQKV